MNNHRFILQPYRGSKTKQMCPNCRHRFNTFKLYIDTETGNPLADHVGRCDRAEQCGYHYTPREHFKANPDAYKTLNQQSYKFMEHITKPFNTIPQHIMDSTLRGYDQNNFAWFLFEMFGPEDAIALIEKYKVGTAKHWPNATIFWQVDVNGKIRTGKIMLYNHQNCKRVKEPYNHIAWVHNLSPKSGVESPKSHLTNDSGLKTTDFLLKQCLFGEHLLPLEPFKTVAIVESEKTAIIASYYYPNYIWLAAGSLEGLNVYKCRVLKGRTVRLYPDVNGFMKWQQKARELNARMPDTNFLVDDNLRRNACPDEIARGIDIADQFIETKLLEWKMEREWGLRDLE